MHGDISRATFDSRAGYRSVIHQQGRVTLDADVNEQADIATHHDERRTEDVVGRVGGPLPADAGQPGPFAIRAVAAGGVNEPADAAWADLVVMPGHYYVDGVLVESAPPTHSIGWPLGDQPFAPASAIERPNALNEPSGAAADERYALYLEVSERDVTADEQPRLLEPALGGPDTSLRRQSIWQVRWEKLAAGETCSDLGDGWLPRNARRMTAQLQPTAPGADPCQITSAGGYRRLENQLYRVEVHADGAAATFLWSRENGSVVAAIVGSSDPPDSADPRAQLRISIDREGRDPELMIRAADLVELTSRDRQLLRVPGMLARVVAAVGLDLDLEWVNPPAVLPTPADVRTALGTVPIVRRWEGEPLSLTDAAQDLEDGIQVQFSTGGTAQTGDYWQIPARTVRLAYGISQQNGTIEWPPSGSPDTAVEPMGPPRHIAPLGILKRTVAGWTLEHDCRTLFPPLTGLAAIDLAGGDGQEDTPGEWLDQPVRVVVRRGSVPVTDARVMFTTPDAGELSIDLVAPAAVPAPVIVKTGTDGVAAVRWRLNGSAGPPSTQTLTAQRIDDKDAPFDVALITTARVSRTAGIVGAHIKDVSFLSGNTFLNDVPVGPRELVEGFAVSIDDLLERVERPEALLWLELDLPWPVLGDGFVWFQEVTGYRTVRIDAQVTLEENRLIWRPEERAITWLVQQVWTNPEVAKRGAVAGRFFLNGTGTLTQGGLAVNTHVVAASDGGRVHLEMPTDDLVAGGTYGQWFRLQRDRLIMPNLLGLRVGAVRAILAEMGLHNFPDGGGEGRTVTTQEPKAGDDIDTDTQIRFE